MTSEEMKAYAEKVAAFETIEELFEELDRVLAEREDI